MFHTDIIESQANQSSPPVAFGATDIRLNKTSRGTDPRFPDWSYHCSGYDQAARALSFFGFTPMRKLKSSFTVREPKSNLPGGDPLVAETVTEPMSRSRSRSKRVQMTSQGSQTPLSAYRLPSGHYLYRYPARISHSYSPSQIKRQRDRQILHYLLIDLRTEFKRIFAQSTDLEYLYSLPIYTNLESAKTSKFYSLSHCMSFIPCLFRGSCDVQGDGQSRAARFSYPH